MEGLVQLLETARVFELKPQLQLRRCKDILLLAVRDGQPQPRAACST
jgi:hypothetical protein